MRRVKVLVGCCWGLEWEWERFVEEEDGEMVEGWVVVSIGSGTIVFVFFPFFFL